MNTSSTRVDKWAFVMPVRNDSAHVVEMCAEFQRQRKRLSNPTSVHLIVVDDESDDWEKIKLERNLKLFQNVHLFRLDFRYCAGGARNFGIQYAKNLKCDWCAFIDCDDVLGENFLKSIVDCEGAKNADVIFWGFTTLGDDKSFSWIPRFNGKFDWIAKPVAPWTQAIRLPKFVENFPEDTLTDDVIWWILQAQKLVDEDARIFAIEAPLYIYNRRSGGSTKAGDWFGKHPMTLEAIVADDTCAKHGFPDRFISDCIRNVANMYDIRHKISHPRLIDVWRERFSSIYSNLLTGRYGW